MSRNTVRRVLRSAGLGALLLLAGVPAGAQNAAQLIDFRACADRMEIAVVWNPAAEPFEFVRIVYGGLRAGDNALVSYATPPIQLNPVAGQEFFGTIDPTHQVLGPVSELFSGTGELGLLLGETDDNVNTSAISFIEIQNIEPACAPSSSAVVGFVDTEIFMTPDAESSWSGDLKIERVHGGGPPEAASAEFVSNALFSDDALSVVPHADGNPRITVTTDTIVGAPRIKVSVTWAPTDPDELVIRLSAQSALPVIWRIEETQGAGLDLARSSATVSFRSGSSQQSATRQTRLAVASTSPGRQLAVSAGVDDSGRVSLSLEGSGPSLPTNLRGIDEIDCWDDDCLLAGSDSVTEILRANLSESTVNDVGIPPHPLFSEPALAFDKEAALALLRENGFELNGDGVLVSTFSFPNEAGEDVDLEATPDRNLFSAAVFPEQEVPDFFLLSAADELLLPFDLSTAVPALTDASLHAFTQALHSVYRFSITGLAGSDGQTAVFDVPKPGTSAASSVGPQFKWQTSRDAPPAKSSHSVTKTLVSSNASGEMAVVEERVNGDEMSIVAELHDRDFNAAGELSFGAVSAAGSLDLTDVTFLDDDTLWVAWDERNGSGSVVASYLEDVRVPVTSGPCAPDARTVCLTDGRFRVWVRYRAPNGEGGLALANLLTDETAFFTIFDPNNVEVLIKVLDACAFGGFWAFATGLTNLDLSIYVEDTVSGVTRVYHGGGGPFPPVADTTAFTECGSGGSAAVPKRSTVDVRSPAVALSSATSQLSSWSGIDAVAWRDVVSPEPLGRKTTHVLLLHEGRFEVTVDWEAPNGDQGTATAASLTDESGYFWFFGADNVEVVVKVLDGCGFNDRFWVFAGGLTNLEITLTVKDTWTGETEIYRSSQGQIFEPVLDIHAFATCA